MGVDSGSGSATAATPTGATMGILWGLYYEGGEYILIEIGGEGSRAIVRTYAGGCRSGAIETTRACGTSRLPPAIPTGGSGRKQVAAFFQ